MSTPPSEPVVPRWGLGEAAGAFALGVFLLVVGESLAVGFGAGATSVPVTIAGLAGEWVGFLAVPWFLSRARGTASLARDFGLRLDGWRDVALGAAVGVGTYVVVLVVLYPPFLWLLRQITGQDVSVGGAARQLGSEGRGIGFVVLALAVGIGAPLAEETFFRGLLLPPMQRRLGGWGGVIATGLLFGLAHAGGTEAAAIPALAAFGVVLCVLAWRTGRIGPGIVAHMVFNAISLVELAASR